MPLLPWPQSADICYTTHGVKGQHSQVAPALASSNKQAGAFKRQARCVAGLAVPTIPSGVLGGSGMAPGGRPIDPAPALLEPTCPGGGSMVIVEDGGGICPAGPAGASPLLCGPVWLSPSGAGPPELPAGAWPPGGLERVSLLVLRSVMRVRPREPPEPLPDTAGSSAAKHTHACSRPPQPRSEGRPAPIVASCHGCSASGVDVPRMCSQRGVCTRHRGRALRCRPEPMRAGGRA